MMVSMPVAVPPTASRGWSVAVLGAAIAVLVAQSLYFRWTLDDAYITFSYAQNWRQGHGLIFNVGERVEGYTCFLWVIVSAVGLALGADIVWWSRTLGILSAIAAVCAAWQLARELAPARVRSAAVATALMVAGYPALAWWAVSGMETALFACLITVAIWRHVRDGADSLAAPVCLALASMTRPEGCLLAGLLCLDAARTGSWRRAGRYAGIVVALFGPYYAWRCWYYGYPLPNTFYAKVGETSEQVFRGLVYVRSFFELGAGWVLLIGVAAAAAAGLWRRSLAVYAFLLAYVGYVIIVGGDVFFYFRFLLPLVPVLSALTIAGILTLVDRTLPARSPIAIGLCGFVAIAFLAACSPLFLAQTRNLPSARGMTLITAKMCEYLRAHTSETDAIATGGIGQIKFCTQRPVIDMLGLADLHIAHRQIDRMGHGWAGHEKFDSEYVLARWPKYIVIPRADLQPNFPVPAVRNMWDQPVLKRYYLPDQAGYRRVE